MEHFYFLRKIIFFKKGEYLPPLPGIIFNQNNLYYSTLPSFYVALSEYPWMPTIVSNFLCFTICFLTNSDCYTMDELEFTHLTQGEEVEALEFFYTTWAEADDMDVPSEVPDVPKELVSLLESSTSLVARYKGEMVAQMLGEVHKKEEVVGRKLPRPEEILPAGTPWTPWALYKKAWGARLVTLGTGVVEWPADVLTENPGDQCVMEITFLAVDKRWRRKGVASRLLEMSEEMAKEKGCQKMVLIAASPVVMGMYERRGWERWRDSDDQSLEKLVAFVKNI